MIQIYEEIEEEFEVPSEESDSNSKTIPCDIYHEQKNVLTLNKGRVREEDFNYFGIETAPIQKNNSIECDHYKALVMSYQPERCINHQRLITIKENAKICTKLKRFTIQNGAQLMNSSKISSSKILELLFPKKE